jgi:hypothetical protein
LHQRNYYGRLVLSVASVGIPNREEILRVCPVAFFKSRFKRSLDGLAISIREMSIPGLLARQPPADRLLFQAPWNILQFHLEFLKVDYSFKSSFY